MKTARDSLWIGLALAGIAGLSWPSGPSSRSLRFEQGLRLLLAPPEPSGAGVQPALRPGLIGPGDGDFDLGEE